MDLGSSEHVCYVHCTYCNTILAVSVPCCNMYNSVTVRCGHCAYLISVNFGPSPPFAPQDLQLMRQDHSSEDNVNKGSDTSGASSSITTELNDPQPRLPPVRPPEKRQRVPSAYNKFIKEEIQRIKACNPEISHREAFSAAAKNWAHFPHIQFGLNFDAQRQARTVDQTTIAAQAPNSRSHGFY